MNKRFTTVKGGADKDVAQLSINKIWFLHARDEESDAEDGLFFMRVIGHWCCKQDALNYYCAHEGRIGVNSDTAISINPAAIDVIEPIEGGALLWLSGRERAFFVPHVAQIREAEPAAERTERARGSS